METGPQADSLYYGEPAKPQGDTNLPPSFENWPTAQSDQPPAVGVFAFTDEQMADFSPEDRQVIQEWLPYCHGMKSELLDGCVIRYPQDVLAHAKAYLENQTAQANKAKGKVVSEADQAFNEELRMWQEQCRQRKAYIQSVGQAWHDAVEQKKETIIKWNAHVAEKHTAYNAALALPVPPRPTRKT